MEPDLWAELLRRAARDQDARKRAGHDWAAVMAVDADNLPWLKRVIAGTGWPGRSLVGEDGAHAAWLLVQHADRDPAFQRSCLGLITEAARHGEATPAELAYLTDRVLLAEGQPQEYGTQMAGRDGRWQPRQLREPARSTSGGPRWGWDRWRTMSRASPANSGRPGPTKSRARTAAR
jgi:Family of unknown function (DUF6624)